MLLLQFRRRMIARIVVVKSDASSAVDFPDFLKDNRETNCCVPLRITVLRCFSGMVATCQAFPEPFAGECVVRESTFRINSRFITYHDAIDVFMSTAIVLF